MSLIENTIPVKKVNITLFGQPISKSISLPFELMEKSECLIPFEIDFNSSWHIEHECVKCGFHILKGEDYENSTSNFIELKNLNSTNYNLTFLQLITDLLEKAILCEVDNVYYINRVDFEYIFDMQRKSSIAPKFYECPNCKSEYIIDLRIGSPMNPERDSPFGTLGKINIQSINNVVLKNGGNLIELMNSSKL